MIQMGSACVADKYDGDVSIECIDILSIVSLKVAINSADTAGEKLPLASSGTASSGDPQSLWLGPDRWLLVSDSITPDSIIRKCNDSLGEILHNAVDYSAGLTVMRVAGPDSWCLLAAGSSVDFRREKFPVLSCCRTRLANVAAVIVAASPLCFDLYVDRSYGTYLNEWLCDSSQIDFRG